MLHEHSSFNCSSCFINHLCPRDIFEATTCMPLADFSYLGCQFEKGFVITLSDFVICNYFVFECQIYTRCLLL